MSEVLNELDEKCKKSVEHFKQELLKMRGSRANTGLVENLQIDYYGSRVPLNQVGLINAPEPRLLTVQVYDQGAVELVEKAIMQSNLGLNPSRDGNLIRIAVPALNEERRKKLIKALHSMAEEAKVSVRRNRKDAIDMLKKQEKDKEISEDELRKLTDEVQKFVDKSVDEISKLMEAKEKEMMEV